MFIKINYPISQLIAYSLPTWSVKKSVLMHLQFEHLLSDTQENPSNQQIYRSSNNVFQPFQMNTYTLKTKV
jgi:hypothetical protein